MTQVTKEKRVYVGIEEQNRGVISTFTSLLANEFVLCTKTRNYHWCVVGPHFNDYHKTSEQQYDVLEDTVDDVAERIQSVREKTSATLEEFKQHIRLTEEPGKFQDASEMAENLLHDHESIIKMQRDDLVGCRKNFNNIGTNDYLTGPMEKHEKTVWIQKTIVSKSPSTIIFFGIIMIVREMIKVQLTKQCLVLGVTARL